MLPHRGRRGGGGLPRGEDLTGLVWASPDVRSDSTGSPRGPAPRPAATPSAVRGQPWRARQTAGTADAPGKTTPNDRDVESFLVSVADQRRREDAGDVLGLMREVTGATPVMWGTAVVGFGRQPYTTADGKRHEWFAVGLSPRKAALTLYGLTYYDSNRTCSSGWDRTRPAGLLVPQANRGRRPAGLTELVARAWETNHAG